MKDIRVSDIYRFVDFVCEVVGTDLPADKRETLAEEIAQDFANNKVYIEPS